VLTSPLTAVPIGRRFFPAAFGGEGGNLEKGVYLLGIISNIYIYTSIHLYYIVYSLYSLYIQLAMAMAMVWITTITIIIIIIILLLISLLTVGVLVWCELGLAGFDFPCAFLIEGI